MRRHRARGPRPPRRYSPPPLEADPFDCQAATPTGSRPHLLSLDVKAARLFVAPGDIGHGLIGALDMARGALRIEQQASVAIADQRVLEGREIGGVAGKA